MNRLQRIREATVAAVSTFIATYRKGYTSPAEGRDGRDLFSTYAARRLRYELYWAAWSNTLYDGGQPPKGGKPGVPGLHPWAAAFKADNGLYRYINPVFNIAHRIGEIGASRLIAGRLDPDIGDGRRVPTCLPITGASASLRSAIRQTWVWSNFDERKPVWLRNGIVMGDAPLKVVDDPASGMVYLKAIHPKTVWDKTEDDQGQVQGYEIREWRPDPRLRPQPSDTLGDARPLVLYREVARKTRADGKDRVEYRTYLGDEPHDWTGNGPAWDVPYGFVPLVWVRHLDVGLPYGQGEYGPGLNKGIASDDTGSKINDAIRILVDPKWIIFGATENDMAAISEATTVSVDDPENPQAGRQTFKILGIANESGKAQAMAADFKIGEMSAHALSILKSHMDDYPEVVLEQLIYRGDASGESYRQARKPAESKLSGRREPYLSGIKRALQMAASIGGIRGYKGFDGINEGSYESGALDFTIVPGDIYVPDKTERLQEQAAEGAAIKALTDAGLSLETALRRIGWDEADITEAVAAHEKELNAAADRQRRRLSMGTEQIGGMP